ARHLNEEHVGILELSQLRRIGARVNERCSLLSHITDVAASHEAVILASQADDLIFLNEPLYHLQPHLRVGLLIGYDQVDVLSQYSALLVNHVEGYPCADELWLSFVVPCPSEGRNVSDGYARPTDSS